IGEEHRISEVLTVEQMCPPLGAAVLGLQCREAGPDRQEAAARSWESSLVKSTSRCGSYAAGAGRARE
ncbi:hydroxymethylbilane synthase, partial [Kitasatospora sp. NPDC003701]